MDLVFSHANGIPAKTYSEFLKHFENDFNVHYINQFGHQDYPIELGWGKSVKELKDFIEKNCSPPIIAIGHSFGGVLTLMLASEHPELFKKIFIMDPPLFSPKKRLPVFFLQILGLWEKQFPLAKNARKRKDTFQNKEEAKRLFQRKKFFKAFHPKTFEDYIEHALTESNGKVKLSFHRDVEADIFAKMPSLKVFSKCHTPGTLYFSKNDSVLNKADLRWLQKTFPLLKQQSFNAGHLMALEKPHEIAADIMTKLHE